jgi:hypothetical protein
MVNDNHQPSQDQLLSVASAYTSAPRTYPLGITIHRMMYGSKPGTPPGISAIRNASLNHHGLIPKKAPRPLHTPATIPPPRVRLKAAWLLFTTTPPEHTSWLFLQRLSSTLDVLLTTCRENEAPENLEPRSIELFLASALA